MKKATDRAERANLKNKFPNLTHIFTKNLYQKEFAVQGAQDAEAIKTSIDQNWVFNYHSFLQ